MSNCIYGEKSACLNFRTVRGLAAALIISIGAGYFFSSQDEDYSAAPVQAPQTTQSPPIIESPKVESQTTESPQPVQSSQITQSSPQPESQTVQSAQKVTPIPRQTGALNAADLSLGNFSIDDTEDKVRQALGEPLKTTVENGLIGFNFSAR